jgi:hypothetical protein
MVFVLEARASLPVLQRWSQQWHFSHSRYYSVSSGPDVKAGILLLVQNEFLKKHRISCEFESLIAGRACWVMCSSPLGPPLYVLACHVEKFTDNMIDLVRRKREALGEQVSTSRPRPGTGLLLGDFNYTNQHCNRWDQLDGGPTVTPRRQSDLWSQRRWSTTTDPLVDMTLNEETHVRHVRQRRAQSSSSSDSDNSSSSFAPAVDDSRAKRFHGAPLDHVFGDLPCWLQLDTRITVTRALCPFEMFRNGISDHAAIVVMIKMRVSRRRTIRPPPFKPVGHKIPPVYFARF